jgi:hypothetical protein
VAREGTSNVDLGDFVVVFGPNNHSGSRFVDLTMIGRGRRFVN